MYVGCTRIRGPANKTRISYAKGWIRCLKPGIRSISLRQPILLPWNNEKKRLCSHHLQNSRSSFCLELLEIDVQLTEKRVGHLHKIMVFIHMPLETLDRVKATW